MSEIVFIEVASKMSGVEFSTHYLARCLDRSHWTPLVICPEEGDLPARCRAENIPVAIVPLPRFFSTSLRVGSLALVNPLAILADVGVMFFAALIVARFLRSRSPALVVPKGLLAQFYGGLAARWAGFPCVWHIQDRVSNRAGPVYAWVLALTGRILAREIIVDAESIARQLIPIVPRDRVHVIWNGVDTREFSPQVDGTRVRTEWQLGTGDLAIGVAGRLTRWKGQHLLIDAFARLAPKFPNARVFIVGSALFDSDAYARELQARVHELGLADRVIFAGFRWDMPQVFAALDVVAHTALDKDSTPLAVISAMASGKAIVCARVDGTAQLFDDGTDGLLFVPGDVDDLSKKLEMLLQDMELRKRLGYAARLKAERELSVERFTIECERVFERAVEKSFRRR